MGAELLRIAERPNAKTAIVFVHGFGGKAEKTWQDFPALVAKDAPELSDWSVYSLGYSSNLMPDFRGMWSGDPDIATLATYLRSRAIQDPLKKIERLAFVAHSMGGLVVQRALVDHDDLAARVSHVVLYGTPSNGLKKVGGFLGRLKRQTQDMGLGSGFIKTLRDRWRAEFGDASAPSESPSGRPFGFWTVAGDRDEFVPAESSLDPFATPDRVVVPGNHLQIVKPEGPSSMSLRAAVDAVVGTAKPGGPWNAARVAVEMGQFHEAVEALEPHAAELDDPSVVQLALALEAVGREEDAIRILTEHQAGGTDPIGVLAGRLKRRWWNAGLKKPADTALALYRQGYETSAGAGDAAQAYYHGINVAFMTFAHVRDEQAARDIATEVLKHVAAAKRSVWSLATKGEANLYLGDVSAALDAYREAVATNPGPREMESMFTQADRILSALEHEQGQKELADIFSGVGDPDLSQSVGAG